MKTIAKLRARILFTISVLLLALSLPALVLAVHFPGPGDPVPGAKVWAENAPAATTPEIPLIYVMTNGSQRFFICVYGRV